MTTPHLTPLDARDASWTLIVALRSPHPRDVAVSFGARATTVAVAEASCVAWYVDCSVRLAPVAAGQCAYLVYSVQHVNAPTPRTSPPCAADVPCMLATLSAVPKQFATTYAYACPGSLRSKNDIVQSLVAAGTVDVALVTLSDDQSKVYAQYELRARSAEIRRQHPYIAREAAHRLYLDERRGELSQRALNEYAGRVAVDLERTAPRPTCDLDGFDPTVDHSTLLATDTTPYVEFAQFVDDAERIEYETYGAYARANDYADFHLNPLPDFIAAVGTSRKPVPAPPRTIADAFVMTPMPADMDVSVLFGRRINKWVATTTLDDLGEASVVLFWPKKHRVRLLGFAAACRLLQDALTAPPTDDVPLGYDSLSALAAAVMEMLCDNDVMTSYDDVMTMQQLATRYAPLRSLYIAHGIDLFDDAISRSGIQWLATTCATVGWLDVGAAIVTLVDQGIGDWHKTFTHLPLNWSNLATTLQFVTALLDALGQPPYCAELVFLLWDTVVANLAHFRDERYDEATHDRVLVLRCLLQLEARILADVEAASPTTMWLGGRLPSSLFWVVRSFVTAPTTVVSIVQRFRAAMDPALVLLPFVLDVGSVAQIAPLLPDVRASMASCDLVFDVVCDAGSVMYMLPEFYRNVLRWRGVHGGLLRAVSPSFARCSRRIVYALVRAVHKGLVVTACEACAIADLLLGYTTCLVDKSYKQQGSPCGGDANYDGRKGDYGTPPTKAMHAVLLILDRLSPLHVPRFVDDLVDKVVSDEHDDTRLYHARRVLYPTIRFLDAKLPMKYASSRDALCAVVLPMLTAAAAIACGCDYCTTTEENRAWLTSCDEQERDAARLAYLHATPPTIKRAAALLTASTKCTETA
ncbi:hypothetical protein SDRG_04637 [Saprolegnia diclina VS20]|uniref:Uncharacterized protein n=1 Tax=Saprolegnia diclina (strain VS20) TaxID=1156394 RepID=T0QVZ0_SAPDV|nr:hypothetical protein SDRG_04637 [Saprolegnia diclina VS20]EQC38210.1 hypothetical protein SDRG_04637 [Saprolegnia diclina VS20]|eukprot:XP_008608537.1 hypothetical protein SDRG_04637 [Saprolegnia diclina VS20]